MEEQFIIKKLMILSNKAKKNNEVPVSAVVIHNKKIIATSYNQRELRKDVMAHAEVLAIKKTARKLRRWNLSDCELYVTLKPCPMCMEVIKQSRIQKVHFLLEKPSGKHEFSKTTFEKISDEQSSVTYQQLLSSFFRNKR